MGAQTQLPALQTSVAAQTTPQAPQFISSPAVSTQTPEHSATGQTHCPARSQTCPPVQVPQLPEQPSLPQTRFVQLGAQGPHTAARVFSQSLTQLIPNDPTVGKNTSPLASVK